MKINISLKYETAWGQRLVIRVGGKSFDMTYRYGGMWERELDGTILRDATPYSFAVMQDDHVIREEWKEHVFFKPPKATSVVIRDAWRDRPENAPFWSSAFSEVIFRREDGASHLHPRATEYPWEGNLRLTVSAPEVRSEESVAIIGSGPIFDDWKKPLIMRDGRFPIWTVGLDVKEPFEYKFVIVDRKTHEPILWEEGGNHFLAEVPSGGKALVVADLHVNFPSRPWRGAGVAVPVFALRSEESFGIGEFHDIRLLVDWAVKTGQNFIQLLPINDTTMTRTWQDSYPYNAVSSFALHPHFIHLPAAGVRRDKAYKELQAELNALPKIDYERVNNEKDRLLRKVYAAKAQSLREDPDYLKFITGNSEWLVPYAAFSVLRDEMGTVEFSTWGKYSVYSPKAVTEYVKKHEYEVGFYLWEQYVLDVQLKEAVQYAHLHGVALKGDLPIGVSRTSADAWTVPALFHMDSQAGAPPDAFSVNGQNWGFPTYNWEKMAEDNFAWWRSRLGKMSEYFDAYRIDHILGFFRIWEIPADCVHGLLGYFNPALPYSADDLRARGFDMYGDYYSTPMTADWALGEIFGDLADEVRSKYIRDGRLAPEVNTQKKVVALFDGDDEHSRRLRDGLLGLLDDVLFIEDPRRKGYYHPRISAQHTLSYRALDDWKKKAFNELYNDFFYHRHNEFWKHSAYLKLPTLTGSTGMLACGEDLGMIPACVPETMDDLRILSLEIQRMPKSVTEVFGDPAGYPYYSVCATGTHDTSPLRAWWEEDPATTRQFYYDVLHCGGEVPFYCEPWVADLVVKQHLDSPSMLCILPLQDWIATDGEVRYGGDPADERINVPAIPRYYWRYRMHCSLESLLGATRLNDHLRALIDGSGRGK